MRDKIIKDCDIQIEQICQLIEHNIKQIKPNDIQSRNFVSTNIIKFLRDLVEKVSLKYYLFSNDKVSHIPKENTNNAINFIKKKHDTLFL
jgi:hypothetical protein